MNNSPVLMSDFSKKIIEQQKQKANLSAPAPIEASPQSSSDTQVQTKSEEVTVDTFESSKKLSKKTNKKQKEKIDYKNLSDIEKELYDAKKQNGLTGKAADFIKGKVGFGYSSKKIQDKINQGVSNEEIQDDIKNYRRQQENLAHAIVDTLTGAAVICSFVKGKDSTLLQSYKNKISGSNFNILSDKLITISAAIGASMLGGVAKNTLMSIDRIGSKKYKVNKDETTDKKEYRLLKQAAAKDKANENFRNFTSGAINGLTAPLVLLGGGLGAPIYAGINLLNRYFIATKEDASEKSFGSFIENVKNSPVSTLLSAATLTAVGVTKGRYSSIYEKNLKKAFNDIHAKGSLVAFVESKTSYHKLAESLIHSDNVQEIISEGAIEDALKNAGASPWGATSEQIEKVADETYKKLSEKNIFFLKILQIQKDQSIVNTGNATVDALASLLGGGNGSSDVDRVLLLLSKKLKMDGAPTYTCDEIRSLLNKAFGDSKYSLVKDSPLGVGTVAETYLVKDASGTEVVVKLLKKEISQGKIEKDANTCIELIEKSQISEQEKGVLIRTLRDISNGVIQEANLHHEKEAAEKLAKSTTLAQVAKGIEVADVEGTQVYVMEKAQGVCLQRVTDYLEESREHLRTIEACERASNARAVGRADILGNVYDSEALEEAKAALEALKEKYGNMEGFDNLTSQEARAMLELYQDVLVEQFHKVVPGGKTIHADIHPGNIMIDINMLKRYASGDKACKSKVFTLIDTGNTIEQTPEIAMSFLTLSKYIDDADTDKIIDFVLEGAQLPSGKIFSKAKKGDNIATEEEMSAVFKKIKTRLVGEDGKGGVFFDDNTALGKMTNQQMIEGVMGRILFEEKIIPSEVQGNLIKAQTSAANSLDQFRENNSKTLFNNLFSSSDEGGGIKGFFKLFTNTRDYRGKQRKQEKANLRKLPPAVRARLRRSKTAPKKNSVEYLRYVLKQDRKTGSSGVE